MRTASLVSLLLASTQAFAIPWFVPDTDTDESLRDALESLWPGTPVEIVIGAPEGDGFELGEVALVLRIEGREHSRPVDGEIRTAVALARSWLRELESTEGWVPKPENLIVVPEPEPEPEPEPILIEPEPEEVEVPRDQSVFHMAVGAQNTASGARSFDGIRVAAGASRDRWAGEMALFLATGSATQYSGLDEVLTTLVPDWDRASLVDLFSVSVGTRLYLGNPEPERRWSGGTSLIGGVELRSFVAREVVQKQEPSGTTIELDANGQRLGLGPVLGIGIDLWMGAHAGLRLSELDRIRIRDEGNGTVVRHDLTTVYEIVYRP